MLFNAINPGVIMRVTVNIRDENVGGGSAREWAMEVMSERMTVREIIRSRVYQEVQDHNVEQEQVFRGLVEPTDAEQTLNGWKLKKPRQIDWKRQFELVCDAYERNQILVLINDRQAGLLDEEYTIEPNTEVTFLRLSLLVGG
jgi:hypothetical protein